MSSGSTGRIDITGLGSEVGLGRRGGLGMDIEADIEADGEADGEAESVDDAEARGIRPEGIWGCWLGRTGGRVGSAVGGSCRRCKVAVLFCDWE